MTEHKTAATTLRCPVCDSEAYVCSRPHHGSATWAIHCRNKPYHNEYGQAGVEPPASVLAEWCKP